MTAEDRVIENEPEPYTTPDPEATLIAEGAPAVDLVHGKRLGLIMGALMLAMFLAALDQTIVSTALPRITSELNGLNQLAWVVTAYLLTSTASTPIWGKISDIYGRKIMLQAAIVIFLLGSVLAGMATSMTWLIVTRGIQGLGGGGLMVLVMAVIADVIPPRERGRYVGLFGGVFAVSSILGPLLGGWFVDTLTWRWIFYINVPLGIAALIVIAAVLHIPQHKINHSVDYLGAVLLVAGVVLGLLLTEWGGHQFEWLSPQIIGMAIASITLIALFIWRQIKVPEPLVPMSLFKNRVFGISNVIGFLVGLAMFGAIIYLPIYLQIVQGSSPTTAGLQMIPMMAGLLALSIISGRVISRTGRYKVFPIIGMILSTIGMFMLSRIQVETPYWNIAIAMVILGAGLGCVMQVLVIAVQNAVKPNEIGVATSGATFFRSIGGTFGTAIFGAIMTSRLASNIEAALPPDMSGHVDVSAMTNAMSTMAQLPATIKAIVLEAFSNSIGVVFFVATFIVAIGIVLAFLLPEVKLRGLQGHAAPPME